MKGKSKPSFLSTKSLADKLKGEGGAQSMWVSCPVLDMCACVCKSGMIMMTKSSHFGIGYQRKSCTQCRQHCCIVWKEWHWQALTGKSFSSCKAKMAHSCSPLHLQPMPSCKLRILTAWLT